MPPFFAATAGFTGACVFWALVATATGVTATRVRQLEERNAKLTAQLLEVPACYEMRKP